MYGLNRDENWQSYSSTTSYRALVIYRMPRARFASTHSPLLDTARTYPLMHSRQVDRHRLHRLHRYRPLSAGAHKHDSLSTLVLHAVVQMLGA